MEKTYRYKNFGVVIYPPGSEKVDFLSKTSSEITIILRDLGFWTPVEMSDLLCSLQVPGNKKKNTSERYFSRLEFLRGQLELGSNTNRPHYQIFLSLSIKITKKQLVNALSLLLFQKPNCSAISVLESSENPSLLISYCQKEMRANLEDEYSPVILSNEMIAFSNYLRRNPEAKYFLPRPIFIRNG
jgi:hypothetical protein